MGGSNFVRLPENCISHIFSLTSPRDVCRCSAVSPAFRSASESDTVWERFLPTDYSEIISMSVSPVEFSSKKQLYFRLCDSILIDGGKMQSFYVEKSSGKKCYILSARRLGITACWRWINLPESSTNGLETSPVDLSVKLGAQVSTGIARIMRSSRHPEEQSPHAREDGWMEIEMGEFFNDEGDEGEVEMSLREVSRHWWKSGLIVEGIEVRPRV